MIDSNIIESSFILFPRTVLFDHSFHLNWHKHYFGVNRQLWKWFERKYSKETNLTLLKYTFEESISTSENVANGSQLNLKSYTIFTKCSLIQFRICGIMKDKCWRRNKIAFIFMKILCFFVVAVFPLCYAHSYFDIFRCEHK